MIVLLVQIFLSLIIFVPCSNLAPFRLVHPYPSLVIDYMSSFLHRQVQVHHEWCVDWTITNIHDRCIDHDRLLSLPDSCSIQEHSSLLLDLFLCHFDPLHFFDVLLPSLPFELLHGLFLSHRNIIPCHSLGTPALMDVTETMYRWLCSSHCFEQMWATYVSMCGDVSTLIRRPMGTDHV